MSPWLPQSLRASCSCVQEFRFMMSGLQDLACRYCAMACQTQNPESTPWPRVLAGRPPHG